MAQFRYFAEVDGQTVQLSNICHEGSVTTKAHDFSGQTPDGRRVRATRKIERKSNPSNHACGPRCVNATRFLCECSCGGKNHASGSNAVAALAPCKQRGATRAQLAHRAKLFAPASPSIHDDVAALKAGAR